MKLSWFFVIFLLAVVALFSVQNADAIKVRFLGWEASMSAALVIQLAALLGALVGLIIGVWGRPRPPARDEPPSGTTPPMRTANLSRGSSPETES
jgi:hypothetical protein